MRRARRKGEEGYPVMVFGPEEPLALIAAAAIGRWAFRHRSAFLPSIITLTAFTGAAMAHGRHAGWWGPVTAVTAITTVLLAIPHALLRRYPAGRIVAGILAWLWRGCGIDRAAERAYAASVIAVTGGWLAAAIAIGPAVKPLPVIAVLGTLILGIPWWAHRRRRARVRAERTIDAWPDIAQNIGLPDSRIVSLVVDAWGWTARVILRKGTTAGQAIDRLPAIESGLGLRPGSARAIPDRQRADHFILRIIENDPHAEPIPWPGPTVTTITKAAELGLFEDGRPVRVLLLRRNILIGGMVGSGKSGIVNVILAILTACRDVVIWGVDLKGGMELKPWAVCMDRLATTPAQATGLFQDAIGKLNQRADRMATQGARVWEPTPEDPALIIIVDEYAELPGEAREYADSVARRGRAVAVNMIAATQRPTQEAMGRNAVRSQMDVRICLRVRERRDVDLILGQGSFNAGWHAHALTRPGTFLISAQEHTVPERARAYLIDDDRVARHTGQYARGPDLGTDAPDSRSASAGWPQGAGGTAAGTDDRGGADVALWAALRRAGPEGVSVAELLTVTGMTRPTLYRRLRAHARAGRVVQTVRGSWRAPVPSDGAGGDGRPPPAPRAPRRPPGRPRRDRRRPPGRDGE